MNNMNNEQPQPRPLEKRAGVVAQAASLPDRSNAIDVKAGWQPTLRRFALNEHDIHRVLRSLPDRAAPASLEERVFAEIARRAALPWWRQSFARWPLAARAAFLVVSAVAAAAMIVTFAHLLNIIPDAVETNPLVATVRGFWNIARGFCTIYLARISALTWTVIFAVVATSYAALFGFGAAAYRYLWKVQ